MAKGMKRRLAGDILILLPGIWGSWVIVYFTFLTGIVPLSDVFPAFYYLYFPFQVFTVVLIGFFLKHLFDKANAVPVKERVLWIAFVFLFTGVALPVYRYTRMRGESVRGIG